MSGTVVGTVLQGLSGGLLELREGAPSLEPARETSTETGGGPASLGNVLMVSGERGVTLWGGDLGFFYVNFQ